VINAEACKSWYKIEHIGKIGYEKLQEFESKSEFFIELGEQILTISPQKLGLRVCADPSLIIIAKHKLSGHELFSFFRKKGIRTQILMKNYGFVVAQVADKTRYDQIKAEIEKSTEMSFVPTTGMKITLVREDSNIQKKRDHLHAPSPWITNLVNSLDQESLYNDIVSLANFNRYSLGSGILSARNWIVNTVISMGYSASNITQQSFPINSVTGYNVIVRVEGAANTSNWVIHGCHYDSTSQSPTVSAPGAEDDASGCAGVLGMLRAYKKFPPAKGTTFFMFYAGEEQGLYGSKFNAQRIVADGDKSKVRAVFCHDMIGYYATKYGVLLETRREWESTLLTNYPIAKADYLADSRLGISYSFNPFGSDHVSYLDQGMPALLAIDQDWDRYPNYHRTTDLPSAIKKDILYDITRLELAVGAMKVENP